MDEIFRGRMALSVSLNIANAFNILPWVCIRRALSYHEVPVYLRNVIGDYLRERIIEYRGRTEALQESHLWCSVMVGAQTPAVEHHL